ncbi:hypothetical protein LNQ03_06490 [Klebsiella pneumoniae subsp. pneumoniae]|nr:hypothetical protein [Klebsiella pneumoniae subsp. pneumoniae]
MVRTHLSAVFCLPAEAAADEMVQESRCVKGSILLNHRLEKNMLKIIRIFLYSLQGRDALPNISTTGLRAVASLTVSKILPGNYRPLNTSIPVCLASLSVTAKDLCSGRRQINVYVLQLPKGNGLAFDRVARQKR